MIKALIAPCAFKGTFSPAAIAKALSAAAVKSGKVEPVLAPLADGGDGTVEALNFALGGAINYVRVSGPLGDEVVARWLSLPPLAVVELASASGIGLLGERPLEPLSAHTYGLGQVISNCLVEQPSHMVVAVGGSASTDGGSGALLALGARFYDKGAGEIALGGQALRELVSCDLANLQTSGSTRISIATDVANPLLGASGAAFIFAPQKGANAEQCHILDRALANYADKLESATGRLRRDRPGAGAAGGAAFGLSCAFDAEIVPGFQLIANLLKLPEKIAACDLVLSGEGRVDRQTLMGKGVGELARLCRAYSKPLWLIAGQVAPELDCAQFGVERVLPVSTDGSLATLDAIEAAAASLFAQG
jgi:glycerate kinase